MTILSVFLIETAVIFALILLIILVFRVSNKKKTVDPKKTKKQTSSSKSKTTFLTDWKTWIMIIFGYLLVGITHDLHIFSGGPSYSGIIDLPGMMLYVPLSGIFYSLFFATFVYLALRSVNSFVSVFGALFGIVCTIVGTLSFWFIPYNCAHLVQVSFPLLGFLSIPFPVDPTVSWYWIVAAIMILYIGARMVWNKDSYIFFREVPANMILIISAVLFLPQLFYL